MLRKAIGLFAVAVSLLWTLVPRADAPIGFINFMIGGPGDITILHKGAAEWLAAKLKMDVLNGDRMTTKAESRCEVKLTDGSLIRVGENSQFEFSQASLGKATKHVKAELTKGRVWVSAKPVKGSSQFQVKSPTAVCAIRGTIYRMEVDSTTKILVYDGAVDVGPSAALQQELQKRPKSLKPYQVPGPYEVPPPYQVTLEQWIRIVRGFQVEIRPNGLFAKSRIDEAEDAKLDWVRWNKERDRLSR